MLIYIITRRGLACVAYPCEKAMRRPEFWDRHGGTNSHVFFISMPKESINAELGSLEALVAHEHIHSRDYQINSI